MSTISNITSSNLQMGLYFCKVSDTGKLTFWLITGKNFSVPDNLMDITDSPQLLTFPPSQPPLSNYPALIMIVMTNPHPQQLQKLQNQWAKPRGGHKVNTEIKSPFEPNWMKVPQAAGWPTKTCPVRLHPSSVSSMESSNLFSSEKKSQLGSVRSTLRVLHKHRTLPVLCQVEAALPGKTGMKIFLYNNTTKQFYTYLVVVSYILTQPYSF